MIKIFFTVYQIYMVKLLNQIIHSKSQICIYMRQLNTISHIISQRFIKQ